MAEFVLTPQVKAQALRSMADLRGEVVFIVSSQTSKPIRVGPGGNVTANGGLGPHARFRVHRAGRHAHGPVVKFQNVGTKQFLAIKGGQLTTGGGGLHCEFIVQSVQAAVLLRKKNNPNARVGFNPNGQSAPANALGTGVRARFFIFDCDQVAPVNKPVVQQVRAPVVQQVVQRVVQPAPVVTAVSGCPKCRGKGGFDTWGKPQVRQHMHYKTDCNLCGGSGRVQGSYSACGECKALGGFSTFNKPCLQGHMHYKYNCRICNGAGYLISAPTSVVQPAVVSQPVVAQAAVTQSAFAQPAVAQRVVAQPAVVQRVVAQPAVAQPVVAQAAVPRPAAIAHAVPQSGVPVAAAQVMTMTSQSTPAQADGGGNTWFLDRHDVRAPPGQILTGFALVRPTPSTLSYTFTSSQARVPNAVSICKTPANDAGGGKTIFLDRHQVMAPGNSLLNGFKLDRAGANRYSYTFSVIMNAGVGPVLEQSTPANDWGAGRNIFLDRHPIQAPQGYGLKGFQLYRPTPKTLAYKYWIQQIR